MVMLTEIRLFFICLVAIASGQSTYLYSYDMRIRAGVGGGAMSGTTSGTTGGAGTNTAAAGVASRKLSRSEINVVQTMIIIIICFVIFWSVPSFTPLLMELKVS